MSLSSVGLLTPSSQARADFVMILDIYAEEVRDAILSYCELYKREDFEIDCSDSGIDYNFD